MVEASLCFFVAIALGPCRPFGEPGELLEGFDLVEYASCRTLRRRIHCHTRAVRRCRSRASRRGYRSDAARGGGGSLAGQARGARLQRLALVSSSHRRDYARRAVLQRGEGGPDRVQGRRRLRSRGGSAARGLVLSRERVTRFSQAYLGLAGGCLAARLEEKPAERESIDSSKMSSCAPFFGKLQLA